ncbi:GntR family transcriptional regulator [Oceaniferula marina]|nr:GntR family transcriptional regulator [Oceaniferula marina]
MEQISEYRHAGVLKEGDKLPSIRAMAKQVAVNPGTVVKAYQELEHDGVIFSQHGKGVFVAALPDAEGMSKEERERPVREAIEQVLLLSRRMGLSDEGLEHLWNDERARGKQDEKESI